MRSPWRASKRYRPLSPVILALAVPWLSTQMTLAPSMGSPVSASVTTPQAHPVTSRPTAPHSATHQTSLAFMGHLRSEGLRSRPCCPPPANAPNHSILPPDRPPEARSVSTAGLGIANLRWPTPSLPQVLSLVGHVVHEYVLAQLVGGGVEDAPLVDPRHLVDELLQVVVAVQHEGVDRDPLLSAPLHFLQRLADGDGAGRVGEVRAAPLQMGRGLPVRDHDD